MSGRAAELLFASAFAVLGVAVGARGALAGTDLLLPATGLILIPSLIALLPRWRNARIPEALRIVGSLPPMERVGLMWIFALVYLAMAVFGSAPAFVVGLIAGACGLTFLWVMLWPSVWIESAMAARERDDSVRRE